MATNGMGRIFKHGGDVWRAARHLGLAPDEIIDFSASINPLGMSRRARWAIQKGMNLIQHYPDAWAEDIRAELSSYHGLVSGSIIVGNGSTHLIYLIPQVFRPEKALIIEPCFGEYSNALKIYDCRVDSIILNEEKDFALDMDMISDRLKDFYDLLYLANPANPTARLYDRDEILDIGRMCRRYGTALVVDEAFVDFIEDFSVKEEVVSAGNIIILRSMTKFFSLAGLRLGYLIASGEIARRFEEVMPPWSVNTVALMAGIESLRDGEFIDRTRDWLEAEGGRFNDGIGSIPHLKPYPSRVNYILVKILSSKIRAKDIHDYLLKKGMLIRDCSSFSGLGDNFFRISVRRREENELLLSELKRFFGLSDKRTVSG